MSVKRTKKKIIPDKCRSCMICYPKNKKDDNSDNTNISNDNKSDNNYK